MKIGILITITLMINFLVLACGGGSSSEPPRVVLETIPEILDEAILQGIEGIFVYIDQGGRAPISIAAGNQDRSTQQPADTQTLFKIASLSKLFIATSAAKLIDDTTINLEDTLLFWLPNIGSRIAYSSQITIRNLLMHRSGVPDFDSQFGFSWQNEHSDIDDTLEYALDLPEDFIPDNRYEYSNTNYLLISKILDKALGYSHRIYIQDKILTPLEMTDTYLLYNDIDPTRLSKGYWDNIERSQQDYAIPGGSMISTVKDISVFVKALNKGSLLSTSEQNIYNSVYFLGHSGWLPGYQSIAQYYPNIDATVIQFINQTGNNSESVASSTFQDIVNTL